MKNSTRNNVQDLSSMRSLLLMMGLFLFIGACSKEVSEPENGSLSGLTESSDWLGTFPQEYNGPQIVRLAWGIFPREHISEERFREMANAGITHCTDWRGYNLNVSENLLDYAHSAGVKVILNTSQNASDPAGVAARFKDHPALAGYYLDDEPDSEKFPELGALAERFRAVDPEKYSYVNLSPITHNDSQFGRGTENYISWLDDFVEKLKPRFLTYDNYTIYNTKGIDHLIVDSRMYENLQVVRDAALKANIDFWAFALTTSHYYGNRTFPIPTMGHKRFYVYSFLAYGAQGIQYFTYWQPRPADSPNTMGHYFVHAPISFEGVRNNSLYNRLKMLNAEIENLSFVFANSEVKWIRHTGSTIPIRTVKLNTELENTPINSLEATGGLIISLLEKEENKYLVVVNRDPEESIILNIDTQSSVKRVLKTGAMVNPENKLRITAGDVAIYAWKI